MKNFLFKSCGDKEGMSSDSDDDQLMECPWDIDKQTGNHILFEITLNS